MKGFSRLCQVMTWVLLVLSVLFHGIIITTLHIANGLRIEENNPDQVVALWPLMVGIVLFAAGTLLFIFLKKRQWLMLVIAAVGAVVLAAMGLYLRQRFPETVYSAGITGGYDTLWKLIWRHMLPLVAVLTGLLWRVLGNRADDMAFVRKATTEIQKRAEDDAAEE